MLFRRGRLSVSSKQGDVKLCLPAVGELPLTASSAITAVLAKMEFNATLINRSSRISPEKSATRTKVRRTQGETFHVEHFCSGCYALARSALRTAASLARGPA